MVKLGIFYEQDDAGKDTGRVQVADEDEDIVYDTFETEEEAEAAMVILQAKFDMEDKITEKYLEWEKACLASYDIDRDELRRYLVNVVLD